MAIGGRSYICLTALLMILRPDGGWVEGGGGKVVGPSLRRFFFFCCSPWIAIVTFPSPLFFFALHYVNFHTPTHTHTSQVGLLESFHLHHFCCDCIVVLFFTNFSYSATPFDGLAALLLCFQQTNLDTKVWPKSVK